MQRWLPIALLLEILLAFRILGSAFPETLPNFQPLAALFFCGAWLVGSRRGFAIPLAIWLLTYPLPAVLQENPSYLSAGIFLTTLLAFIATWAIGLKTPSSKPALILTGSLLAAITFHLITNGAAWIGDPTYAKSTTGLWQSLWSGPPNSPIPSWVFLRNSIAANLIFTAILLAARWQLPSTSPAQAPSPAR